MKQSYIVNWVLRIGIAGEFIGHGTLALLGKAGWFKYFYAVGIHDDAMILKMLFIIGLMDWLLALHILIKPVRGVVFWMAIWGLWTALLRWPIGPDPVWDFFERWSNWGAPLALFFMSGWPKRWREWFAFIQ